MNNSQCLNKVFSTQYSKLDQTWLVWKHKRMGQAYNYDWFWSWQRGLSSLWRSTQWRSLYLFIATTDKHLFWYNWKIPVYVSHLVTTESIAIFSIMRSTFSPSADHRLPLGTIKIFISIVTISIERHFLKSLDNDARCVEINVITEIRQDQWRRRR